MNNVITEVDEEYRALRQACGLIDYEGIGRYVVTGSNAAAFLDHVVTRTADFLLEGQISNALLLRQDGTVVAEVLIHARGDDFLVEVWPAQAEAAGALLSAAAAEYDDVTITDVGEAGRVFGIEGPESFRVVEQLLPFPVASMAYSSFATTEYEGGDVLISRTGVTGEYGFKLHVPTAQAEHLWKELLDAGARQVGLDALNVCRMETRFVNLERESGGSPAYPFEVGLQWMVDLNGDFVGADAVRDAFSTSKRRPICWQADDVAAEVPAGGATVAAGEEAVGEVTFAVWSPTLERVIGTAQVDEAVAASGLEFSIEDRTVRTVSAPFVVATSFGVAME